MGMDLIEIDMNLEEKFQLRLGDDFWQELFVANADQKKSSRMSTPDVTVLQIYESLIQRLEVASRLTECDTFEYTLSDVTARLIRHFHMENLTPDTTLAAILGKVPMKPDWERLKPVLFDKEPPTPFAFRSDFGLLKSLPTTSAWAVQSAMWNTRQEENGVLMVLPVIFVGGMVSYRVSQYGTGWAIGVAILTFLILVAIVFATDARFHRLSENLQTVRGIAKHVHELQLRQLEAARWSKSEVWSSLKATLVDLLHVTPENIKLESWLIKDLGMG